MKILKSESPAETVENQTSLNYLSKNTGARSAGVTSAGKSSKEKPSTKNTFAFTNSRINFIGKRKSDLRATSNLAELLMLEI